MIHSRFGPFAEPNEISRKPTSSLIVFAYLDRPERFASVRIQGFFRRDSTPRRTTKSYLCKRRRQPIRVAHNPMPVGPRNSHRRVAAPPSNKSSDPCFQPSPLGWPKYFRFSITPRPFAPSLTFSRVDLCREKTIVGAPVRAVGSFSASQTDAPVFLAVESVKAPYSSSLTD